MIVFYTMRLGRLVFLIPKENLQPNVTNLLSTIRWPIYENEDYIEITASDWNTLESVLQCMDVHYELVEKDIWIVKTFYIRRRFNRNFKG